MENCANTGQIAHLAIDLQYENTPIQIYIFLPPKMKTFRWKILVVFIFLLKT